MPGNSSHRPSDPQADLKAAGRLLGRLTGRFDERLVCLSLVYTAMQEGRPYDITSLAAAMGQSRASLGRLAAALIRSGDLLQQSDPLDRRRVLLLASEAGSRTARRQLGLLDELIAQAARERQEDNAFLISPVKCAEITPDEALPYIRDIYRWAQTGSSDIPAKFLPRIMIMQPALHDPGHCMIYHSGVLAPTGGRPVPNSFTISEVITPRSDEYYRLLGQHFSDAMNGPTIHQIEIDWDGPGTTYQRIAIPHEEFGMILATRYLDYDYDKLGHGNA